ncbi:MAG: energy transducer TonB [Ectothiorhodospiraceae bacterium]|nr:energy transducer TonB [Ectothiorhodospiraceae bacterium]
MRTTTITPNDRLGMTLFVAGVVHALVILGIGFSTLLPEREMPPLIEITLTQSPSDRAPDDYDFLAPDDQDGGGTVEEVMRPSEPSAVVPDPRDMEDLVQAEPTPSSPATAPEQTQTITTLQSEQTTPEPEETAEETEVTEHRPLDLTQTRQQVARDIADTTQTIDWNARYPSKQRINARTRSHAAAAYMHGWIQRVEQIGNLNYPDEARRRALSGNLVVEVTLLPDGTVEDIQILRQSRYRVLDDAAVRVVQMASPFSPVPEEVLDGKERLVITRTWEFVGGERLRAQ